MRLWRLLFFLHGQSTLPTPHTKKLGGLPPAPSHRARFPRPAGCTAGTLLQPAVNCQYLMLVLAVRPRQPPDRFGSLGKRRPRGPGHVVVDCCGRSVHAAFLSPLFRRPHETSRQCRKRGTQIRYEEAQERCRILNFGYTRTLGPHGATLAPRGPPLRLRDRIFCWSARWAP